VDRGCRDMSGVIGPLLQGAEVSDDQGIADDESRNENPREFSPPSGQYIRNGEGGREFARRIREPCPTMSTVR
jgi:hypothetical protein